MQKNSRAMKILQLSLEKRNIAENLTISTSELIAQSLDHVNEVLNLSVASDISLPDNETSFQDYSELQPSLLGGYSQDIDTNSLAQVSNSSFSVQNHLSDAPTEIQSTSFTMDPSAAVQADPLTSTTELHPPSQASDSSISIQADSATSTELQSHSHTSDSSAAAQADPPTSTTEMHHPFQAPDSSVSIQADSATSTELKSHSHTSDSSAAVQADPLTSTTEMHPPSQTPDLSASIQTDSATSTVLQSLSHTLDSSAVVQAEPSTLTTEIPSLSPTGTSDSDSSTSIRKDHSSDNSPNNATNLSRESSIMDCSASENIILPPPKKKRKRCVDEWKQTKERQKREHGDVYMGRTLDKESGKYHHVPREKRTIGSRCSCKPTGGKKCGDISDEDRECIFNSVWAMTWNERKVFVKGAIDKVVPSQRKSESGKRKFTFVHHLTVSGKRSKVCQVMFLHTTGLKQTWVRDVLNDEINRAESTEKETTPKPTATAEKSKFVMKEFLDTIPKLPSHYRRKESNKIYLEPTFQNYMELFREYINFSTAKEAIPVGRTFFMEEVKMRNLSIFKPRNDRCDTCIAFENGQIDDVTFNDHREKELRAREAMSKDTEMAKSNLDTLVITMDLQAVLQSPRLNASALYYKTKLCVHNFTVFNNVTKQSHCYVWSEVEGGLSSHEFASCLIDYLKKHAESFQKIIIFSDGCTYQNRNKVMSKALSYFSQKTGKIVLQKVLEKGHTQMPVDSVHSVIDRKLKDKHIYCPSDYIRYIQEARINPEPYTTSYLDFNFFKNFEAISTLKSIRPGSRPGDANVTDIRQLQYEPSGTIFFKLNYEEESQWQLIPMKRNESTAVVREPCNLYSERIKIKQNKFNDLQSLKTVIPSDYHAFYDQLPH